YIAKNQDIEGLNYKILASSDPDYPILAKKANYKNTVIVKTRFLVNGEGKIEEIKFYDDEIKFGFHDEVEKSLKKWKFSPVKLNGVAAKMYFYKTFVFKLSY
ncbi:MAG: energy transducer TonB, partial [Fusobacteriaceae bacterium]|nr:energy transducer TonB [Fusobacteriaceae bacterium]